MFEQKPFPLPLPFPLGLIHGLWMYEIVDRTRLAKVMSSCCSSTPPALTSPSMNHYLPSQNNSNQNYSPSSFPSFTPLPSQIPPPLIPNNSPPFHSSKNQPSNPSLHNNPDLLQFFQTAVTSSSSLTPSNLIPHSIVPSESNSLSLSSSPLPSSTIFTSNSNESNQVSTNGLMSLLGLQPNVVSSSFPIPSEGTSPLPISSNYSTTLVPQLPCTHTQSTPPHSIQKMDSFLTLDDIYMMAESLPSEINSNLLPQPELIGRLVFLCQVKKVPPSFFLFFLLPILLDQEITVSTIFFLE